MHRDLLREPTEEPSADSLTRRQVMALAGQIAFLAPMISLTGCGGSGGGSKPTSGGATVPMKTYTGSVTLPAGVNPANVLVVAGLNTTKLVNGRFTINAPADVPTPITVCEMSARSLVLMGMLNPTSSTGTLINADSSAVGLLFFALGGSNMTRDGAAPLYSLIAGDSSTASFASVVSARLAGNPYAVGKGDPRITSALITAAKALGARVSIEGAVRVDTPAATLDLIQPTGLVNGVTFLQASSGTGFQVSNTKRRMGFVYTYLTGHVDKAGNKTLVNPPQLVGEVLQVPSTHSLFALGRAWTPVESANVELELVGSDAKTLYTMVYLTQVYGGFDPPFFNDPMWEAEVVKWNESLSTLGSATFIGFLTNIFVSALGFGGLTWELGQLTAAAASFNAIPSVATLITQASTSNPLLGDIALTALKEFVAGDISATLLLHDMAALVEVASAQAATVLAAGAETSAGLAALTFLIEALIVAGALVLAADVGAIALDTSTGDRGNLFTATVIPQVLKLTPLNPTVIAGDPVDFTVGPPSGVTGTIEYHWSQTGSDTFYDNLAGTSGSTLVSTNTSIELKTLSTDKANNIITVTGYLVSGTQQTEIGSAQTKVIFNQSVTLHSGQVVQSNPITLPGQTDPTYTVYGFATFTPELGKTAIVSALGYYGTGTQEASLSPADYAGGAGTFVPSTNVYSYKSAADMPQPYAANGLILGLQGDHCYAFAGGEVAAILFIGLAGPDDLDAQVAQAKAIVASINIIFQ